MTTEPVGVAPDPACIEWSRAVIDSIVERTDIDLVVFASYRSVLDYIAPDDPTSSQLDDLREQIVDTFERILASGASVAVIDDSPSAPFDVPECVDLNREQYDPCTFSDPTSPENLVTEAADLLGQVTRIDPRPWYCDALRCHSVVGGVVVLFDNNHLTGTYSRSLAPLLGVELERALDAGLAP